MLNKTVIDIPLDDKQQGFREGNYVEPKSVLPEKDKTPVWYYRKLRYYLSFYNMPIGMYQFSPAGISTDSLRNQGATSSTNSGAIPYSDRYWPVQQMIRMAMYYMGKQPNLDYAWLTQDTNTNSLQAQWIKGQNVSEFVNYFRGLIIQRLGNARFTAKAINRDADNRKTEAVEKLRLKYQTDQMLKPLQDEMGIEFNPVPNAQPKTIEDIEGEVDKNFYDENSQIYEDLANGIFFSNRWAEKFIQEFMYVVICGRAFFEHYVERGWSLQRVIPPWQCIWDNRVDNDFGAYDKFRGKIEQLTLSEISNRFPQLTFDQMNELQKIMGNNNLQQQYNSNTANISWFFQGYNNTSTITCVTMYWRDPRDIRKISTKNRYGVDTLRKAKDDEQGYMIEDLYCCTVIGNKYIVEHGNPDNVVPDLYDKNRPMFPITKFQPNTFFGDNVSEVARIHKIQDELDMLDYKIREMIGRAKGKVYFINGDKLPEGVDNKELLDNLSSMGIQVTHGTGVSDDPNDRKPLVEMVDWTLDPNIYRLVELYKDREVRMGKIMSTSPVALGQEYRYIGLGQQQNTVNQNTLGVAYTLDGFMDWLVMNMRYACNQQKLLATIKEKESLSFVVGDKGLLYLNFTKNMRFEDLFIELVINDAMTEQDKKEMEQVALAWAQNSVLSPDTWLKVKKARSYTEAIRIVEKDLQANMERQQQQQMALAHQQGGGEQAIKQMDMQIVQYKEMMENYRKELDIAVKAMSKYAEVVSQVQATPPYQGGAPMPPQEQQVPPQEQLQQ